MKIIFLLIFVCTLNAIGYANEVVTESVSATAAESRSEVNFSIRFKEGVDAFTDKDYNRALEIYQELASKGYAPARVNLGAMYLAGIGTKTNRAEGLMQFRLAAEAGDSRAQYAIAESYLNGFVGERDPTKAFFWFMKSAQQGFPRALRQVGRMYLQGNGVTKDQLEASRWSEQALTAFLKQPEEYLHVASIHPAGVASVKKYFSSSVIAEMYENGEGTPVNLSEAIKWYKISAEAGHRESANKLGDIYYLGAKVPKDEWEGMRWYRVAALAGEVRAQYTLGSQYERGGIAIEKDAPLAAHWYRLAAKQGDYSAQIALGKLYERGIGVYYSLSKAYIWFAEAERSQFIDREAARASWDPPRSDDAKRIISRMNKTQLRDAEAALKQCRARDFVDNECNRYGCDCN